MKLLDFIQKGGQISKNHQLTESIPMHDEALADPEVLQDIVNQNDESADILWYDGANLTPSAQDNPTYTVSSRYTTFNVPTKTVPTFTDALNYIATLN